MKKLVKKSVENRWKNRWKIGGQISGDFDPVFLYDSCGTYNVQLIIVDDNGCNDTIIQPVDVYCEPIANFSADTVCQGNTTQFTNLSNQGPNPSAAIIHPHHILV